MAQDELLALAERVEAATGADRELDKLTALAAGYTTLPDGYGEGNDWWTPDGRALPRVHGFGARPPAFTKSMNDAVSLVPSDAFIAALSEIAAEGMPGCCLCTDTSTSPPTEFWGLGLQRGDRWEILARCITAASLRAIAGAMPDDE